MVTDYNNQTTNKSVVLFIFNLKQSENYFWACSLVIIPPSIIPYCCRFLLLKQIYQRKAFYALLLLLQGEKEF